MSNHFRPCSRTSCSKGISADVFERTLLDHLLLEKTRRSIGLLEHALGRWEKFGRETSVQLKQTSVKQDVLCCHELKWSAPQRRMNFDTWYIGNGEEDDEHWISAASWASGRFTVNCAVPETFLLAFGAVDWFKRYKSVISMAIHAHKAAQRSPHRAHSSWTQCWYCCRRLINWIEMIPIAHALSDLTDNGKNGDSHCKCVSAMILANGSCQWRIQLAHERGKRASAWRITSAARDTHLRVVCTRYILQRLIAEYVAVL